MHEAGVALGPDLGVRATIDMSTLDTIGERMLSRRHRRWGCIRIRRTSLVLQLWLPSGRCMLMGDECGGKVGEETGGCCATIR